MNRRSICFLLALGLWVGTQAYGQIAPAIKAAAAVSDADRTAIKQFVTDQANKLASTDPAQQSAARDALLKEVSGDPQAAFLDAYAQAINDGMLTLADNPSIRVRLNAAIVLAKVAEKAQAQSLRLKPAVLKFRADKDEAVALWGVKAHKPLVLAQLRSQVVPNDPLVAGLPAAIKNNLAAPVVQAAYEALQVDYLNQKGLTEPVYAAAVAAVQDLLAMRAAQYKNGTPDGPLVDTLATGFLVDISVWKAQRQEQRTRTAQLLCDVLAGAASEAAKLPRLTENRDELIETVQAIGKAISVTGSSLGKKDLVDLADPVAKIEKSADPDKIIKPCDDLITAVSSGIPGVKKSVITTKPAK